MRSQNSYLMIIFCLLLGLALMGGSCPSGDDDDDDDDDDEDNDDDDDHDDDDDDDDDEDKEEACEVVMDSVYDDCGYVFYGDYGEDLTKSEAYEWCVAASDSMVQCLVDCYESTTTCEDFATCVGGCF